LKGIFREFLRRKEHLAVVVDEFGSFAGVISLEDILEALIGHEIMDEGDEVEDMRAYARKASPHTTDGLR
jgi:CBS domain containing-hemolysin-like protein